MECGIGIVSINSQIYFFHESLKFSTRTVPFRAKQSAESNFGKNCYMCKQSINQSQGRVGVSLCLK